MKFIKAITLYILLIFPVSAHSQDYNFKGINIQGQLEGTFNSNINLNIVILSSTLDTIWHENHPIVPIGNQNSFNLFLGQGSVINSNVNNFEDINWLNVSEVKFYQNSTPLLFLGSFGLSSTPFALHSLNTLDSLNINKLEDIPEITNTLDYLLKFNGTDYLKTIDLNKDTVYFSWYSTTSLYSDTALFSLNNNYTDSSFRSLTADTCLYSNSIQNVIHSDTSYYVDSSTTSLYAINNWGLSGNSGEGINHSVGTNNNQDFTIRTNNLDRIHFTDSSNIFNQDLGYNGFNITSENGILFTGFGEDNFSGTSSSFLYFNNSKSALTGGQNPYHTDTSIANYSFTWGKNVSTNGTYSTIFGCNSHGDSATAFGNTNEAMSSFAMGTNCRTSSMGVAIGDNSVAGFYRNIAIGKNIIAGPKNSSISASAAIGIGTNVLSSGATTWALGNNVTANGNFSTAIGNNASTFGYKGSFIYGDFSTTDTINNTNINQFMVRANGGYYFYSNSLQTMGVSIAPGGGSWNMISDKSKKENIIKLGYSGFHLEINQLNLYSWKYKNTSTIHIGPMAQEFNPLFNVGELHNYISMIDSDGVTFYGIKSLKLEIEKKLLEDDSNQINNLNERIENEKIELEKLEQKLNRLYEGLDN